MQSVGAIAFLDGGCPTGYRVPYLRRTSEDTVDSASWTVITLTVERRHITSHRKPVRC